MEWYTGLKILSAYLEELNYPFDIVLIEEHVENHYPNYMNNSKFRVRFDELKKDRFIHKNYIYYANIPYEEYWDIETMDNPSICFGELFYDLLLENNEKYKIVLLVDDKYYISKDFMSINELFVSTYIKYDKIDLDFIDEMHRTIVADAIKQCRRKWEKENEL